jgi:hypothetical protein
MYLSKISSSKVDLYEGVLSALSRGKTEKRGLDNFELETVFVAAEVFSFFHPPDLDHHLHCRQGIQWQSVTYHSL